jgi:histidinol dehydrogenase
MMGEGGVALRRILPTDPDYRERIAEVSRRGLDQDPEVERVVREILEDVRRRGDAAVREHTERIEGRAPGPAGYELPAAERSRRAARVSAGVRAAIERAAERIRRFHRAQVEEGYRELGGTARLKVMPLRRVGLYVPGGTARYPSSVLMTAIPAAIAGVDEIVAVTPSASDEVLAAAEVAGVTRVFELGGAQAIGALAFGTETVPRVDKIVGPGNQWVAAAKRAVYGDVDIDSIAGPSEVVIIADDSANPAWVAADLLAQAEHDVVARAVLISTSEEILEAVDAEVSRQLETLPRRDIASRSIAAYGAAILADSLDEAVAIAEDYAPEHLGLAIEEAARVAEMIRCAGAVFVGHHATEAAGDYVAGPNHVLPTAGAARFSSPLGVYDFRKRISVLELGRDDLAAMRHDIVTLAGVEGLDAHARSVELRFEDEPRGQDPAQERTQERKP